LIKSHIFLLPYPDAFSLGYPKATDGPWIFLPPFIPASSSSLSTLSCIWFISFFGLWKEGLTADDRGVRGPTKMIPTLLFFFISSMVRIVFDLSLLTSMMGLEVKRVCCYVSGRRCEKDRCAIGIRLLQPLLLHLLPVPAMISILALLRICLNGEYVVRERAEVRVRNYRLSQNSVSTDQRYNPLASPTARQKKRPGAGGCHYILPCPILLWKVDPTFSDKLPGGQCSKAKDG
jgi:hypothetical protein